MLGSLLSCCVAEYIIEKSGLTGALQYGVMGDDLILYSCTETMESEKMVALYKQFGLRANLQKTSSGPVGEFLKRVLSRDGIWAYPALELRSVIYANPWVDHYTYNEEKEVSNCWLTFLSRLLPHCRGTKINLVQHIMSRCVGNLNSLFGKLDWASWLKTPVSAGGGGCMEMSCPEVWCVLDKLRDVNLATKKTFFDHILGLVPYKRMLKPTATMKKLDLGTVLYWKGQLKGATTAPPNTWFRHEMSITRLVYDYIYNNNSLSTLKQGLSYSLPRGLRVASPQRVIEFLLRGVKEYTGITTIQHTKDATSTYSELGAHVVRAIISSKRFANIRYISAAVTVYMSELLKNVYIPYGTW